MTTRRYSDGTLETDLPARLCNRYSYESHRAAAKEAKERKPETHREVVYVCDLCNQFHIGLRIGRKFIKKRARADNNAGPWSNKKTARKARRKWRGRQRKRKARK